MFSSIAFRILGEDTTSVVGENTNNGKHCECTKSMDSQHDHIKSEAAAVGVFTNSFSN